MAKHFVRLQDVTHYSPLLQTLTGSDNMAYQIETILMTLKDVQSHSPTASLFQYNFCTGAQ